MNEYQAQAPTSLPLVKVYVLPFLCFCPQKYLEPSFAFGLVPSKQSFYAVFLLLDTKFFCKETHTLNIIRKASFSLNELYNSGESNNIYIIPSALRIHSQVKCSEAVKRETVFELNKIGLKPSFAS